MFCDIDPAHAEPRPGAGRGRDRRRAPSACCRCTSSATRRTCRRFEALAAERGPVDRRGRLRGARRSRTATARRVGRAQATSRTFALLPQQADHHGRGRRGGVPRRRARAPRSTPSETRAARRTWAGCDHDRLGYNYRLDDLSCALGVGPGRAPRRSCWPRRAARRRASTRRLLAGARRARAARARDSGGDRVAGSSTWCSCPAGWTATT